MSKNIRRKALPRFRDEDEERAFWDAQDSTGYIDWSKAERIALPRLKPSLKTISLRLPEATIAELKMLANRQDVPYQSLLKVFLSERIAHERRLQSPAGRKRA
jgi:predicted DNA binding CopG/RHH family protein